MVLFVYVCLCLLHFLLFWKVILTLPSSIEPMPHKHSGHASKNGAGQLVSPLRTIMFGQYFTDSSGARKWGLLPAVFRRSEPMSDAMNAALWNPYYVICSTATWLILAQRYMENIGEYWRLMEILSESFRILQMISRCFKIFQDISRYFRILQDISGIFRECFKVACFCPGSGRQACGRGVVLPRVPDLEPLHRFVHSTWVWTSCLMLFEHFNSHDVLPYPSILPLHPTIHTYDIIWFLSMVPDDFLVFLDFIECHCMSFVYGT